MNKKCYILNASEGASGVVKFEDDFPKHTVLVDIKDFRPLGENEVFEIFFISDKKLKRIGSMDSGKEKFDCVKPADCNGVIITRRNFGGEGSHIEFWGGEKGCNIKEIAEKMLEPKELSEEDLNEFFPEVFSPENYFGGGFKWKRVNGYYSMYKYSIVMHVLSLESVYKTIGRWGHYLMGIKKQEATYISIALPQTEDEENVFGELDEYSYPMNYNGKEYRALCVAVDDSGEYFLY